MTSPKTSSAVEQLTADLFPAADPCPGATRMIRDMAGMVQRHGDRLFAPYRRTQEQFAGCQRLVDSLSAPARKMAEDAAQMLESHTPAVVATV